MSGESPVVVPISLKRDKRCSRRSQSSPPVSYATSCSHISRSPYFKVVWSQLRLVPDQRRASGKQHLQEGLCLVSGPHIRVDRLQFGKGPIAKERLHKYQARASCLSRIPIVRCLPPFERRDFSCRDTQSQPITIPVHLQVAGIHRKR